MNKRTKRMNVKGTYHSLTGGLAKRKPAHRDRRRRDGTGELGMAEKEETQEEQERFSCRSRGTQSTLDKPPSNGRAGILVEGTSLRLTRHVLLLHRISCL